jgi:hypothetical protein
VIADLVGALSVNRNVCTVDLFDEIVNYLGPISFGEVNPNELTPLKLYAAPEEVIETLDDIVNRLMDMVLQRDVLPLLLLASRDVCDGEVETILDGVATFRVDRLPWLEKRQIALTVTPYWLIRRLLLEMTFPDLPVRPRVRFDEFADLPDRLNLGPHYELHRDGPLPDVVTRMLRSGILRTGRYYLYAQGGSAIGSAVFVERRKPYEIRPI